jgi:hypothetical protein
LSAKHGMPTVPQSDLSTWLACFNETDHCSLIK